MSQYQDCFSTNFFRLVKLETAKKQFIVFQFQVSVSFEKDQEDVVVNEHVQKEGCVEEVRVHLQKEGCVEEARPSVEEASVEEAGDVEEARLAGG